MAQVKAQLSDSEEREESKPLRDYLKKFSKLTPDKANKLAEDIRALKNPKINEESIVKIIDFAPKDSEDINKIFTDITLSEDEANKIVELVSKY